MIETYIMNPFINNETILESIKIDFFNSFHAKSISFSYCGNIVFIKKIYDNF